MQLSKITVLLPKWLLIASCLASATTLRADVHWTYAGETGPDHWSELEPSSQCTGRLQSPINIIRTTTLPAVSEAWPLYLYYPESTLLRSVTNDGHSIKYDFQQGDEIEFLGTRYGLVQLHFHEPSEHTLNGVRFPIEMHMVHFSEEASRYTVLAVLGYEGRPSPGYDWLESYLPLSPGQTKVIDQPFDLTSVLPATLTPRFHYEGSLTTPPCSENVDWVVFEQPFMLSEAQVNLLKQNMPTNNYRGVQPLNDRNISLVVH